jgi:manganese oxidase
VKQILSRKQWIATAVVVAVAVVVAIILLGGDDPEPTTEIAGMKMTQGDIREMTRDSMGVNELEKVQLAKPADRTELKPSVEGATKVFDLRAEPIRWEYREDQSIAAWAYNGQIPGPVIRVVEGDRVRVDFTNELPVATTVHWHGVDLPFKQDGVPGITQEPIKAGEKFTYEFVAKPAGTRFYHTHGSSMRDEAGQLDMGLSGAFVIEPRAAAPVRRKRPAKRRASRKVRKAAAVQKGGHHEHAKAGTTSRKRKKQPVRRAAPKKPNTGQVRDYQLILDEWNVVSGGLNAAMMTGAGHAAHDAGFNLFTINGRAAPDFEPLHVEKGDLVRIRMINAGSSAIHPMHLHGHQFTVVAQDGNPVPAPARVQRNTYMLGPGETVDVVVQANNPGVWMLHCHELHHADAGMMTLFQYEGFEPISGGEEADHGESAEH